MTDVQTSTGSEVRHDEQQANRGTAGTRRAVLAGAGALGAGCLLAACGSSNPGSDTSSYTNNPVPAGSATTGATGGGTTGGGSTGGNALAAAADIPVGGGAIKGDLVITQPSEGTFKAFSKVCTHQGCDVSKVDGGVIICPCHGSHFSIEDGSPQQGPATKPLAATAVKKDGANIVAV